MGDLFNETSPQRQHHRRRRLIEALLIEIEYGSSVVHLYSSLLARQLCETDHVLEQQFGAQLAKLTPDPKEAKPPRRSTEPIRRRRPRVVEDED